MLWRAIALCALSGCASATPRATPSPVANVCDRVEAVGWLRGRWCGAHEGGTFCESWRDEGGALVGAGRFEREGRGFSEALRVEAREGGVFYVAQPEGEGTTAFRLTRCGESEAVFENPAHDFPSRITYRRRGSDGLVAVAEGAEDGGARRSEFTLTRTE
jgi:hypothetical protein